MSILQKDLRIKMTENSRLSAVDMDNIPFGRIFSDHMLVARFENGKWQQPEIIPYGKLGFSPSISALNYGQAVFEGMKAIKSPDGDVLLFRPEDNYHRMNRSGARLCMPEIPREIFIDGLKELIRLDKGWVPNPDQGSLYIRPLYFATDEFIGVKASESYIFTIFTCPVGAYYKEPVNLLATKEFVRAAIGGTGSAKAAGNYAASLLPDKIAKSQGYHNILWLDAREHQYIEECGTMNVFFVIGDTVVAPRLTGTILEGITRDSCIKLLRHKGYKVEERPVSIYELQSAYNAGELRDAFGTGTAATVSHIAKIGFAGSDMVLPPIEEREISNWLGDALLNVKTGEADDIFGWVEKV